MNNFAYASVAGLDDALAAGAGQAAFLAGGTELLNWMRLGIAQPARVADIGRLPGLGGIDVEGGVLRIGALATLAEIGEHPLVRQHAGALADACLKAASPQVRHRATLGGNVLQKTRCPYFRAEAPLAWGCNKREPGAGCAARDGLNETHAILGWTDACVATQPSDPAVALACLDAEAEVHGPGGVRRIAMTDFHVTQAEAGAMGSAQGRAEREARTENRLQPGELIVGYRVPLASDERFAYVKVRERESFEYALVSGAAALRLDHGRIARARLALGSVAQKPWRLPDAERALQGKPPTMGEVLPVVESALAGARPLAHNAYKVTLAARVAARAVVAAGGQA